MNKLAITSALFALAMLCGADSVVIDKIHTFKQNYVWAKSLNKESKEKKEKICSNLNWGIWSRT